MSTADPVTTFLCSQKVSDFEYEMVLTADPVTKFLCYQKVSDFEHEIGVYG